ncbi:MAG: hypothetical protein ACR2JC_19855 [Chloroflexota bacterium]|nr:MAG: hypothetical protein DLM70_08975 [Chloroflexota bacterium]
MRKSLLVILIALGAIIPLTISGAPSRGYAQTGFVQGDEFNNSVFAAPFVVKCGAFAFPTTCRDPQGSGTWNLNNESPGNLRIYTQPGSLVGSGTNNARNFVVQPFNPNADFVVTTKLAFPATTTNISNLGQTAGIIAYLSDDNFIDVARTYPSSGGSQLEFMFELNGTDLVGTVSEATGFHPTVYLQLTKSGTFYTAAYSYDNVTFTPFTATAATPVPTATSTATTPQPTPLPGTLGYTANFSSGQPYVGVFAWGGTNTAVAGSVVPADFDWFRTQNSMTPAPTALATTTGTPSVTSTGTPAPTSTSTLVPTATNTTVPATATSTSAPTATATNTPVPTPTPRPVRRGNNVGFRYISIWYHQVRRGTFDHIEAQASRHVTHGIWVHVYFPTGQHLDYYQNTDGTGHFVKEFNIPSNSISRYSNQAVVTFQLWSGRNTRKNFLTFNIV